MPYLISYDIKSDSLRLKVSKRLLADGCIRLQKSVFAGQVGGPVLKDLSAWLEETVKAKEDSVFILDVGLETLKRTQWIGRQTPDWAFATDPPDVLFI